MKPHSPRHQHAHRPWKPGARILDCSTVSLQELTRLRRATYMEGNLKAANSLAHWEQTVAFTDRAIASMVNQPHEGPQP